MKQEFSIFAIVMVLVLNTSFTDDNIKQSETKAKHELVLQRAADYCEKLKNIALFFVCIEQIDERIYSPYRIIDAPGRHREWTVVSSRYTYDYQLLRKGEEIKESRTLLRKNNKKVNKENATLDTGRFWYKYVVLGPIGMFDRNAQPLHAYEFDKEEVLWNRTAYVVSASPRDPKEVGWLYGKAWIDVETGGILRVEWEESALRGYSQILNFADKINAKPALRHYAEYQYERNGIRFPSLFEIKEEYMQFRPPYKGRWKLLKAELSVNYSDYRIFTVETEVR